MTRAFYRHPSTVLLETGVPIAVVAPPGLAAACAHAWIWAEFSGGRVMIGAHNPQIAATALVSGSDLATSRVTVFGRVTGLPLAPLKQFVRR